MVIKNEFEVPLAPDAAWRLLLNVRDIAVCVPGAGLDEEIDSRTYRGHMRVRLGPVLVQFGGTAQFDTIDEATRTAHLSARGKDTKGRGTAGARSRFRVVPAGAGSKVEIETDLELAGMIAQYGRASGVIAALSQQIVDEFAANLRTLIAQQKPAGADTGTSGGEAEAAAVAPERVARAELSGLGLLWRLIKSWLRRATFRNA
jgi:carbon monoxide dehydrogenase subunit G